MPVIILLLLNQCDFEVFLTRFVRATFARDSTLQFGDTKDVVLAITFVVPNVDLKRALLEVYLNSRRFLDCSQFRQSHLDHVGLLLVENKLGDRGESIRLRYRLRHKRFDRQSRIYLNGYSGEVVILLADL